MRGLPIYIHHVCCEFYLCHGATEAKGSVSGSTNDVVHFQARLCTSMLIIS